MKVLLALDIVHSVAKTIEELASLVALAEAEVLLLYVREELPAYEKVAYAVGDFKEDWAHQIEKKATLTFDEAKGQLLPHCARVSTEVVVGPPAMMIESVARDEGFDLTVLTPGTHSRVEKFLLGSVSSNVVKHGPGTILICRPKESINKTVSQVVMGIDGSSGSREAIVRSVKQFKLDPAITQITLIHVVNVADVFKLVSPVEYISMVESNLLLEGETFLAEGKNLLAEAGFTRVECVLKEGDPATEIINLAQAMPADLVVIGAQGRTAVQHFLLGSVSERIAMRSPCATAVVKPLQQQ